MRLRAFPILAALIAAALAGCASAGRESSLAGDFLAGRYAERRNSVDDAAAAYAKAHRLAPDNVDLLREAFFYALAAGDVDAATVFARKLLSTDEGAGDGLARMTLAARALKQARLKQARAELDADIDARFLRSIAFLVDVWIEAGLNGPEAALEKLKYPDADIIDSFNALHEALLAEQAGRLEEARAAYEASAIGLGDPVGRVGFGAFLERRGDQDSAREYYKILMTYPGPLRRVGERGLARIETGAVSSRYARVAPAEGAAFAIYAFAGALIQQNADQRARAIEAGFEIGAPRFNYPLALARLALYLKPDFDEARRLIGTILNIYAEPQAAAEILSEIPPTSAHYEQARIEIAAGLMAEGEEDAAVRILSEALRRDPNAVELKWTLATLYAEQGKHRRAVKMLAELIDGLDASPQDDAWRFFVSRAASLLELDRWSEAEADLQRAVEIAPDEPMALNYLGYSWAERGINLDKAFRLIEKAVALQPESGAIIDSLGWAHYQLGQYEDAVAHLEEAAALEPGDPTITDHLGDVYWRLGRRIEARYQWRRSLELEPGKAQAEAIRAKLEDGLPPPDDTDRRERQ